VCVCVCVEREREREREIEIERSNTVLQNYEVRQWSWVCNNVFWKCSQIWKWKIKSCEIFKHCNHFAKSFENRYYGCWSNAKKLIFKYCYRPDNQGAKITSPSKNDDWFFWSCTCVIHTIVVVIDLIMLECYSRCPVVPTFWTMIACAFMPKIHYSYRICALITLVVCFVEFEKGYFLF
jgi:hypothetical protein